MFGEIHLRGSTEIKNKGIWKLVSFGANDEPFNALLFRWSIDLKLRGCRGKVDRTGNFSSLRRGFTSWLDWLYSCKMTIPTWENAEVSKHPCDKIFKTITVRWPSISHWRRICKACWIKKFSSVGRSLKIGFWFFLVVRLVWENIQV